MQPFVHCKYKQEIRIPEEFWKMFLIRQVPNKQNLLQDPKLIRQNLEYVKSLARLCCEVISGTNVENIIANKNTLQAEAYVKTVSGELSL